MKLRYELDRKRTSLWDFPNYLILEPLEWGSRHGHLICVASRAPDKYFVAYQDDLDHFKVNLKKLSTNPIRALKLKGKNGLLELIEKALDTYSPRLIASPISFNDPLPGFRTLDDVIR